MKFAKPGCGNPELRESYRSGGKEKKSLITKLKISDNYADALNQVGVVSLTGKLHTELVIEDIEGTRDN